MRACAGAFVLSWVLVGLLACRPTGTEQQTGPSSGVEDPWARGVNLAHWMAQADLKLSVVRNRFPGGQEALFRRLKAAGFGHVRVPVDPEFLTTSEGWPDLDVERTGYLLGVLRGLEDAGLAVVVDLHPEPEFHRRLREDAGHFERYAVFIERLARILSATDPARVRVELLNEPVWDRAEDWNRPLALLVAAARRGAPGHTLVVSANLRVEGDNWQAVEALQRLQLPRDARVVANFHYYNPHLFTHQGADWGWPVLGRVPPLPYPSVAGLQGPSGLDAETNRALADHGRAAWDRNRITAEITAAADWARRSGVGLTVNEFGVYAAQAPRESRLAWIRDTRMALEAAGVGWTFWELDRGFGFVDAAGRWDPGVLAALGLRQPVD